MAFTITKKEYKNSPLIEVTGKVSDTDSDKLKKELDLQFAEKPKTLLIDISRINYIDSFGLGVLIYFHNAMKKANSSLVIINKDTESYVTKLFEMTKLHTVLNIVLNAEDFQST